MRMDAIASGNPAHYRKCPFCKKYDDPEIMAKQGIAFSHKVCKSLYQLSYKKETQNGSSQNL